MDLNICVCVCVYETQLHAIQRVNIIYKWVR